MKLKLKGNEDFIAFLCVLWDINTSVYKKDSFMKEIKSKWYDCSTKHKYFLMDSYKEMRELLDTEDQATRKG